MINKQNKDCVDKFTHLDNSSLSVVYSFLDENSAKKLHTVSRHFSGQNGKKAIKNIPLFPKAREQSTRAFSYFLVKCAYDCLDSYCNISGDYDDGNDVTECAKVICFPVLLPMLLTCVVLSIPAGIISGLAGAGCDFKDKLSRRNLHSLFRPAPNYANYITLSAAPEPQKMEDDEINHTKSNRQ